MRVEPVTRGERLGIDGVERRHRDGAVVERNPQRVLVDERTTRDVDEMRARFHLGERGRVEQMARAARSRARPARPGRLPATARRVCGRSRPRRPDSARRCAAARARASRTPGHGSRPRPRSRRAPRVRASNLPPGRAWVSGSSSAGAARRGTSPGTASTTRGSRRAPTPRSAPHCAPRAQVTTRSWSNTALATLSTPVPVSCTHRTPAASSQARIMSQREVSAEERVGPKTGGRFAPGELDQLDFGIRRSDTRAASGESVPSWAMIRKVPEPNGDRPTRPTRHTFSSRADAASPLGEAREPCRCSHKSWVVGSRFPKGRCGAPTEPSSPRAWPRARSSGCGPRRARSNASPTRAAARTGRRSQPTVRSSSPRTAASTSRCSRACSPTFPKFVPATPGLQLSACRHRHGHVPLRHRLPRTERPRGRGRRRDLLHRPRALPAPRG